jgi:hypothetical protein
MSNRSGPFEAGIPGCFTLLDASEEVLEGAFQAPQRGLATRNVGCRTRCVGCSVPFQLGRLVLIVDAAPFLFPGVFALRQGTIVEVAVCIQHLEECSSLLTRRLEAIALGAAHSFSITP